MLNIPRRPKNDNSELKDGEKDCLTWHVLFKVPLEKCYLLFVQPSLADKPRILAQYVKQFKDTAAVRNYVDEYRATLEALSDVRPKTKDERQKAREEALEEFKERVAQHVGEAETLEAMEAAAKLADRIGMFDEEKVSEELPRRYLPESCVRSCRYRLFVEANIKSGDIIDECEYCRALAFAKENGFKYDPTKLLDLPKNE